MRANESMLNLVQHLADHSRDVSRIFEEIKGLKEPLTANKMKAIVTAHGALNALLMRVTRESRAARCFASKYLHFHKPIVPIYDNRAERTLTSLVRWNDTLRVFGTNNNVDEVYFKYCCRFLRLYQCLQDEGYDPSVKLVDFLLLRPKTGNGK